MRRSNRLSIVLVYGLSALMAACADHQMAPGAEEDLGIALNRRRRRPTPPVVVPPVASPVDTAPTTPVPPTTPTPPAPPPPAPTPPPTPSVPNLPPGGDYWGFNVNPASPIVFDEPGWDVQTYSRDRPTWLTPEPMDAHHGMDCSGYPSQHRVTTYEELVFRCRNHIMTAIQAEGYGAIALTPDRLLNLSSGSAVIRFDNTTFKSSARDWVMVWISSWDGHMALPAADWAPGLNGQQRDGLFIEQTRNGNYCPRFVRNYVATELACEDFIPLANRIVLSATRRNTVEIRLTGNRLRVSMPNDSIVFSDVTLPAPLPFTEGVVQFGHYSYNPHKCAPCDGTPQLSNTWHWDEIYVAPSRPFNIIRSDRRFVNTPNSTVNFRSPAPAGARLQFSVFGMEPDISFDGGRTWVQPTRAAYGKFDHPESQYWTPMPAGATQVMLRPARAISWWGEPTSWIARDFSIWSR